MRAARRLLLVYAGLNRVLEALLAGWVVVRDPRALRGCWLYPLRDLLGSFIWLGSYTSRRFYWRGETYRFGKGGRITPEHRSTVNAAGDAP